MNLISSAFAQAEQAPPAAEQAPPAAAPAAPSTTPAPAPSGPESTGAPQTSVAQPAAEPTPPPSLPDLLSQMVPILIIMAIVYIIVIRPQQRQAREQKELLKNVRRGDSIVTSSGIVGKVTKAVDDAEVEVEIAPNVRVRLLRTAIAEVRARGEPVKDQSTSAKS
jgi:preprotein translocase subunit YajC